MRHYCDSASQPYGLKRKTNFPRLMAVNYLTLLLKDCSSEIKSIDDGVFSILCVTFKLIAHPIFIEIHLSTLSLHFNKHEHYLSILTDYASISVILVHYNM